MDYRAPALPNPQMIHFPVKGCGAWVRQYETQVEEMGKVGRERRHEYSHVRTPRVPKVAYFAQLYYESHQQHNVSYKVPSPPQENISISKPDMFRLEWWRKGVEGGGNVQFLV